MKAEHPVTKKTYYFIDKCLPFSHSISCALFQDFSDALAYLAKYVIKINLGIQNTALTNYLDDFLFAALMESLCNAILEQFMQLCMKIGVPLSMEKTEYASTRMIFLGILLDGKLHILVIPEDKKNKAINSLQLMTSKKKATVKETAKSGRLIEFSS